jgi:hypothetical protein
MKSIRNAILWVVVTVSLGWVFYALWQGILSYQDAPKRGNWGDIFGTLFALILYLIVVIPGLIYSLLPLPKKFTHFIIFALFGGGLYLILGLIEKNVEAQKRKQELLEKQQQEEKERKIKEEQLKKEEEIERRKTIVLDIINYLYKETEKEVNKTLIPTLINEVYDIYTELNSDNLNDLIINGNLTDFQNFINSKKSELQRLKKLALDAQAKGYRDDEKEYVYSDKMTKEKAFEIFGIKTPASKEEIRKAFREQALKYHTDRWSNSPERIKKIMEEEMKKLNRAKEYLESLGLI